ncbi:receptor-type tyrosine-protein phosphatase alpha-like isoform X3 [Zophobas morio]|uniref:receptor-type tyrosine-protein phosphatase alpha-like isoform X3 n=1 Tax=Zophobas morio TaxID=2755281 RepID=UPI003083E0C3
MYLLTKINLDNTIFSDNVKRKIQTYTIKMYLNLHISIFWILVTRASADVVTLTKNQSITCVLTEESVYSALYISPNSSDNPLIDSKRTLTELTRWVINDWNVSTTQELPFYPVVDVRWEEFPNVKNAQINIAPANVISFSLCFVKRITLNADGGEFISIVRDKHENVEQNVCQWSHYTVRQNKILEIKFSETAVHEMEVWKLGFNPKYIILSGVRIKTHQYDFRYSHLTTLNNAISFLNISNLSNSTDLCISLFVSVDENCYLDVVLESGTTHKTVRVDGFNLENKPKSWKRIEIHTSSYNGTGKLNFYRSRSDDKREGFWAIDKVHICRLSTDVYSLTVKSENSSYTCKTLATSNSSTFCELPGLLGHKCTAKCDQILGQSYPFCEGYKICLDNGTCECSWGFKGTTCNQSCTGDNWGRDCASTINYGNCVSHNNKVGCFKCMKKFTGRQCTEKLPVVLKPPTLVSAKTNFAEISFNLTYGEDEKEPDFYQIQYKESNGTTFENFSDLVPFQKSLSNGTVTIPTSSFGYKIRVLLFVGNEHYEEGVPELVTTPTSRKNWYIAIIVISSILKNHWLFGILTGVFFLYVVLVPVFLYFCGKKNKANGPQVEVITLLSLDDSDTKNIPIKEIETYVKASVEKKLLSEQFKLLADEKFGTCEVALWEENLKKNKDQRYIPYDSTRVILGDLEDVGTDDYINASYIDGFRHCKAYIVYQGTKDTETDFWRMIWLEEVETMVLAVDFNDDYIREDCWSSSLNSVNTFGAITVRNVAEGTHSNYHERVFEVTYMKNQRQVRQLHLSCSWPLYPDELLPILKHLHQTSRTSLSPIVVYSGSETNRSGTLILCDLALHMGEAEGSVNFHVLLGNMRQQRPHMVNNLDYYVLAHLTVLEFLLDEVNPFRTKLTDNLDAKVVEEQCKYLEKMFWADSVVQNLAPQPKMRNPLRLTFVDGYQKPNRFLLCQQPSKRLLLEFWETIISENISHVLFINANKDKLWPCKFTESGVTISVILQTYVEVTPSYTLARLLLSKYSKDSNNGRNGQEVLFFELVDWNLKEQIPQSIDNALITVHYINKVMEENETPILITTMVGMNASSLFTVLCNVLDKHKKEREVDVYRFLRTANRHNSTFFIRTRQLKFLYDTILEYITTIK